MANIKVNNLFVWKSENTSEEFTKKLWKMIIKNVRYFALTPYSAKRAYKRSRIIIAKTKIT